MTLSVLWLFLKVPWVGLLCVVVVFPDHTHSRFARTRERTSSPFSFHFDRGCSYSRADPESFVRGGSALTAFFS